MSERLSCKIETTQTIEKEEVRVVVGCFKKRTGVENLG